MAGLASQLPVYLIGWWRRLSGNLLGDLLTKNKFLVVKKELFDDVALGSSEF